MFEKIRNYTFIALFLCILSVPLLFTNWTSAGVSVDENRNLAPFPELIVEGEWNDGFTAEFESWFMDHLGLRKALINANATLQFRLFDRMLEKSEYVIGRNGDINYATDAIIQDYAHVNLRTEEEVAQIGQCYQTISDWLNSQGIPFYYVQCFDKHTIYPEQFIDTVRQFGDVSKTDQIITYLENHTTVQTISMKQVLIDAKEHYETFSNWGDPTHWSPRGAYVGYRHLMEQINATSPIAYRILQESDYDITLEESGITLHNVIHQDELTEQFRIRNPQAQQADRQLLGDWATDTRHSVWINPNADNDTRLLLMADSYVADYIVDDIAESFSEVWLIWAVYAEFLPEVVELVDPDMVIYESAERIDRSPSICTLADSLRAAGYP